VEELPVFAGAQILFESSNNYANEWIDDLDWYWYVPRAIRNGVFVLFANTSRERPGLMAEYGPGHGHSAIIAPDGALIASAGEESDQLLVGELDLSKASRAEALRRQSHPLFRHFWQTGVQIMNGAALDAPPFEPLHAPAKELTFAVAQIASSSDVAENLAIM